MNKYRWNNMKYNRKRDDRYFEQTLVIETRIGFSASCKWFL